MSLNTLSEKELREQREILAEIRIKAGHLIDKYVEAKDPESKWIKIREFAHVKSAFGLTLSMMKKYGDEASELLAQFQWGRGFDHGKRMLERVRREVAMQMTFGNSWRNTGGIFLSITSFTGWKWRKTDW